MKKFFGIGVAVSLLCATALATIPASAVTAGPYNYEAGCIQSVTVSTTKELAKKAATYYKASVKSRMHNNASCKYGTQTYNTHVAVGTKDAKFFVYSGETSNKMNYKQLSVEDMVKAFEAENPNYQVLAAVNGDFFKYKSDGSGGEPEEPMIQNYQLLKSYLLSDGEARGRGIVGINDLTGKLVYHTIGDAYKSAGYGTTYKFDAQTQSPYTVQVLGASKLDAKVTYDCVLAKAPSLTPRSQLSFTTSDYGAGDYAGKTVYEVELERYRKDTGAKNASGGQKTYYFAQGKITKVITGTANMKPAAGKAYIAALSENQAKELKVGAIVRCQNAISKDWNNVGNAIGFKQQLVANGTLLFPNATYSRYHHSSSTSSDNEKSGYKCDSCNPSKSATTKWTEDVYDYPMAWKARTAIGFKDDGSCVLMAVPKSNEGSWGATYAELGAQFKALGCTNAFLLDGGGSTTMVIRDGNSLSTVFHAEGGSGSEGRLIGNIAIIATLKDGAKAPVLEGASANTNTNTDKETEKATTAPGGSNNTSNKNDKNDKNDASNKNEETTLPTEFASESSSELSTGAGNEANSGCGAVMAFPAILVTAGISLAAIKKKRRK